MANELGYEAVIPNPALKLFDKLAGEWKTSGSHPFLPGTLHGKASFKWIEGGSFMIMHSEVDEEGVPSGIAIFGSDEVLDKYYMLYFDERKVSRMYDVSFHDNTLKFWRNAPGFAQRYTWTISADANLITGKGEISRDGATWEKDLDQTFSRLM